MSDLDFALALQLQNELNNEEENSSDKIRNKLFNANQNGSASAVSSGHNVVDEGLELFDPTPDIYALFREFDRIYFDGKLSCCEVKWSPRMTLCAGLCCYEGRSGLCSIRLSSPLLRLRPRKDLVQTLLHEMIHAFLFVTHNNRDHDAHGPEFLKHMHHINKLSGANITVYHTFHDEVDAYRKHWWQCNGPCKSRKPFYGLVKRAMNRVPGPNDNWWSEHQKTCNGTFIKIKGPDTSSSNAKRKSKDPTLKESPNKKLFTGKGHVLGSLDKNIKSNPNHLTSLDKFLNKVEKKDQTPSSNLMQKNGSRAFKEIDICTPPKLPTTSPTKKPTTSPSKTSPSSSGKSKSQKSINNYFVASPSTTPTTSHKVNIREHDNTKQNAKTNISTLTGENLYNWIFSDESDDELSQPSNSLAGSNVVTIIDTNTVQVLCPACNSKIPESKINEHLDQCLS